MVTNRLVMVYHCLFPTATANHRPTCHLAALPGLHGLSILATWRRGTTWDDGHGVAGEMLGLCSEKRGLSIGSWCVLELEHVGFRLVLDFGRGDTVTMWGLCGFMANQIVLLMHRHTVAVERKTRTQCAKMTTKIPSSTWNGGPIPIAISCFLLKSQCLII